MIIARIGLLLVVAGALAIATPASARGKGGRHGPKYGRTDQSEGRNINRGWQNCLGDFARYCPGQIPQNGAMARCLGPYRTQVAPICAPVLTRWCAAGACG